VAAPFTAGEQPSNGGGADGRPWSSQDVRTELERFLARDLLGPWAGDTEELPAGTIPSERYILGVLSPVREALDAEATDTTASDDGSGEGAGEVTAAAAAALCLYDMTKSLDPTGAIESIVLLRKSGGKSGEWERPA
jgi:hypothetical protein